MMFFLWVITIIALNGKERCLIIFFISIVHFCVFTWSNRIKQRNTQKDDIVTKFWYTFKKLDPKKLRMT
jgi:uncharacterized membrane protein